MILEIASYHRKKVAGLLFSLLYASLAQASIANWLHKPSEWRPLQWNLPLSPEQMPERPDISTIDDGKLKPVERLELKELPDGGGPSQPEMTSFKSVGTDNLVNLFTGDFSYNIPLLDVGGYPVNIYYEGGITMEQEASWVGLGWNINPGNVHRNMRGVPDDFNGQDTLTQVQIMKPNKTWGLNFGADLELLGKKTPINVNLGVALNNYLGPSISLGLRGNLSQSISNTAGSEKFGAAATVSLGVEVNSRTGASFSANASLSASKTFSDYKVTAGLGASTGYNSRNGLKSIQLSDQAGFNDETEKIGLHKRSDKYYIYKNGGSINNSMLSTTISFAKPSYIPSLRMPVTNTAWSGRFQLGLGSFGVAADLEAEVFGQKSEIHPNDTLQQKPLVGYMYLQEAVSNPDYVMDFTRFNDREVTPNTPVISVPQYTYDVFSIQGEGTGGSIRAYRNDYGYVRDNITKSKDQNLSFGADIDPPGHYGSNFALVKTPSISGEWGKGNKLRNAIPFKASYGKNELVYFRNPGENSIIDPERYNKIGGVDLVRFALAGSGVSPSLEAQLQRFDKTGKPTGTLLPLNKADTAKSKRTQVINFLTAFEASKVGLDTIIKSYNNTTYFDSVADTLLYEKINRVGGYRKAHHISQINVTESNGRRYVYGVPVYNVVQKDFTFSVHPGNYTTIPETVGVNASIISSGSGLLNDSSSRDGYVQISTTPAYVSSFLLSGLLSPDYIDVTGNGITEDDIGEAVKFNYSRIINGTKQTHRWRSPNSTSQVANFNAGSLTEIRDDKAMITYGERESWYLQSVESKSMIALFYVSKRADGNSAKSILGEIDQTVDLLKKLDSIALYNKSDLKSNGLTLAKPIKTVHFKYSYKLCQGTPDNDTAAIGSKGKLTLDSIYFTYNGKNRAKKNKYSFSYTVAAADSAQFNPIYSMGNTDRWGSYKDFSANPAGMRNADFPYTLQTATAKTNLDKNASAWMLRKITLPSGGQMEIDYESDDYGYVQNKKAAAMMKVVGFGSTNNYANATNLLYPFSFPTPAENDYVFIEVPESCANATDVYNKYLVGLKQISFKLSVRMPKGYEFIPCYASIDNNQYGVSSTSTVIWIKMKRLGGKSPVSLTALEFLRQQLPGQAFKGYDVSDEKNLKQIGSMLSGLLVSLRDAFTDPVNALRKDGKAMQVDLARSFARLNDPDGIKYGGGYRVKEVRLKDNWQAMTGQYTSSYGQRYQYTTTEKIGTQVKTISSGVASYEPSIGGEENPFQSIIEVADNLPLGPTSYGAVEMPVLDAFFPSPVVGYSKVTVSSLNTDTASRSRIGRQVTEFYTAKEFPVYYSYTPLDGASTKEFHKPAGLAFLKKSSFDYKAHSQGFLIINNDMHGKMKSQSSYGALDTLTRISYTENFYRNTGKNGLDDKFQFVGKETGGTVYVGNMGVDVELMTDAREFSVKASSMEVQTQIDLFFLAMITIPVPTMWGIVGNSENIYRSVTTTKVVNYHSVLDSIVVIDKGSQVSTKNLVYDGHTGEVLITRTNNEFDKPVYSTSLPAYWAYSGMGLAYQNIDVNYSNIQFSRGKIVSTVVDTTLFQSGDEILVQNAAAAGSGCEKELASGARKLIWAVNKNKNNTALYAASDLIFVDSSGAPFTMNDVSFRVIRSGHRNLLTEKVASITSMVNPVQTGLLKFDTASKVITATAIEFKEKWKVDNDIIKRARYQRNMSTCKIEEIIDSLAPLELSINPYIKGLLGNFRPYRNMVFYDARREADTSSSTNISEYGFLKNFKSYWSINGQNNLIPDSLSTQWVWNTLVEKVNSKGQDIESRDALGIYSAVQYGYKKLLPVAMSSNARSTESFYEGFEDHGYQEAINTTVFNKYQHHIDFTTLSGGQTVLLDTAKIAAHTGAYAFRVNPGSTATKQIPVTTLMETPINLAFGRDTTRRLDSLGGNVQLTQVTPYFANSSTSVDYLKAGTTFTNGGFSSSVSMGNTITDVGSQRTFYHRLNYFVDYYVKVTQSGTYSFSLSMNGNGYSLPNYDYNNMFLQIYDTSGKLVKSQNYNTYGGLSGNTTAVLCTGEYRVKVSMVNEFSYTTTTSVPVVSTSYIFSMTTNLVTSNYKNLTKSASCWYPTGIKASENMLNETFSLTPGKKMVLSAWVREDCGNEATGIPCREFTYTKNQLRLTYSGGEDTAYSAGGPIIDGWQRYEFEFTPPIGATAMDLKFINSGTGNLYVDDIRIHPFNANMKSYAYDPVNLRLRAELDANNYAVFYEYDEEGILIRKKVETREGIKTINETRSWLQTKIQ